MGELNQQQKDTIQKLTLAEGQNPESSMHIHGCHRELGGKLIIICLCILSLELVFCVHVPRARRKSSPTSFQPAPKTF